MYNKTPMYIYFSGEKLYFLCQDTKKTIRNWVKGLKSWNLYKGQIFKISIFVSIMFFQQQILNYMVQLTDP